MIKISFFITGCMLFFISCQNKNDMPPGILKPDKMQAVLWDVINADAFTTEFIKKDSAKNAAKENLKLQQQIFAIHHVSKEDFYKSYDYYKAQTPVLKTILDSMITQAERKKSKNFNTKSLQAN